MATPSVYTRCPYAPPPATPRSSGTRLTILVTLANDFCSERIRISAPCTASARDLDEPTSGIASAPGGRHADGRADVERESRGRDAGLQRGAYAPSHIRGAAEGHGEPRDPRGRWIHRWNARGRAAARPRDLRAQPELRLRREPEDVLRGGAARGSGHRGHGPSRLSVRSAAGSADHRSDRAWGGRRRVRLAIEERFGAGPGDALVEVFLEPLPHEPRESDVRSVALRVPHGLPRLPSGGAGDRQPRAELGRLHLRSADRGPDRRLRLPDRRDRGADAVLP